MQKKLIALAIAGLSSAAFAQSNVTIYGVMDMDFESAQANGATQNVGSTLTAINAPSRNRVSSNSSLIGFKGSESLGNGLTAVFQIESGLAAETAGGALAGGRDTFVGLAGGFGTVAAGLLTGPYRASVAAMEVVPGATGARANVMNLAGKALTNVGAIQQAAGASNANYNGGHTVTATRVQNTLAYISPSFSGAQITIAHSTAPLQAAENKTVGPIANSGASTNQTAWTAGLNYTNGPLKVVAAWQDVKDAGAIFSNDLTTDANGEVTAATANNRSGNSKVRSWILGVGYTFGGATTVNLAYDNNKATASGSDTSTAAVIPALNTARTRIDNTEQKAWILSAKHVMGMHEFAGSYVRTTSSVGATTGATAVAIKGLQDQGATGYSLNYGYNLSKRSQLYAFYSQINNKNNAVYDFTTNAVNANTGVQGNGADPRAVGAGLRHSF